MSEHSGTLEDCPVPVFLGHLLLFGVGTGHLDEGLTGAFNETVCALSFGGGCDDIRYIVIDPSEALNPMSFQSKLVWKRQGRVADDIV